MKNLKICLILFVLNANFALAEEKSFIKMASFTYENDSVYGKDSYYSNGLQFYFSTNNKEGKSAKLAANVKSAETIGKMAAEAAKAAGITKVVFDRNGAIYHGKVKALAEAARQTGLVF